MSKRRTERDGLAGERLDEDLHGVAGLVRLVDERQLRLLVELTASSKQTSSQVLHPSRTTVRNPLPIIPMLATNSASRVQCSPRICRSARGNPAEANTRGDSAKVNSQHASKSRKGTREEGNQKGRGAKAYRGGIVFDLQAAVHGVVFELLGHLERSHPQAETQLGFAQVQ